MDKGAANSLAFVFEFLNRILQNKGRRWRLQQLLAHCVGDFSRKSAIRSIPNRFRKRFMSAGSHGSESGLFKASCRMRA